LAAALTPGSTVIHNAASEPHVQDLARLLMAMGARIEGIGSNLMIVHGQVVAGIDFGRLKNSDIKIQGKEVRIHLPNPQILITRLDNARTKVYSRNTGLLVPVDPNLETQVRQEAGGELLQEAALGGIIANARDNARATVTTLLQGMGFEKVEVD